MSNYITFHDISYSQGLYDMDADPSPVIFMKMSGYGYGTKAPYYDNQAARNYQNAIRTGKIPGMYHFAGGGDPVAEADFFVGACSPLADGDIMILDYELEPQMSPPPDPAAWCLAFVNRVHERTGTWPLFYTGASMLNLYGFDAVLQNCALWVAHYDISPDDTVPTNGHPYIAHQFQGSPLDTNALFISLDTLRKYAYNAIQPQPSPPAPSPEPTPAPDPSPTPSEPAPQPTDPDNSGSGPTPDPAPQPQPVPDPQPTPPVDVPNDPAVPPAHGMDTTTFKTLVAAAIAALVALAVAAYHWVTH